MAGSESGGGKCLLRGGWWRAKAQRLNGLSAAVRQNLFARANGYKTMKPETKKGAIGTLFVFGIAGPDTTRLPPRFALREHPFGLGSVPVST